MYVYLVIDKRIKAFPSFQSVGKTFELVQKLRFFHMEKKIISTERAMKPVRPYYSQAISVEGAGKTIFVSGQTWDPKLGGPAREDLGAQAEYALEGMKAILEGAGSSMDDVVKVNFYITNIENSGKLIQVRYRYFGKSLPSSTLVEVSKLWHPDLLIEIDAIAVAKL
jgi:2-iminobutanoate/2-iminopropanoate deaminase